MAHTIAWLAQGKVRLKKPGEPARTIESRFGESIREKAVRAQQRHSWKTSGEGEKFLAGAMLWGRASKDPAALRVSITSLCPGAASGQMLYSLETDDLCAVLCLENLGEEERRLWSKNDKRLSHLTVAPDGAVACSIRHQFGTANIAVRLTEESGFGEVTEGDSLDSAPRWVPNPQRRRLVFQSAGAGRDRNGNFAGLGPFSLQQLDIESGEMKTLAEDPASDFLTPQVTADGTLYYIRRPYQTGREFSFFGMLKDMALFPFRLAYAIFHYLQFFSMIYTGKKLTSDAGTRSREMDPREMLIWGNKVSAAQGRKPEEEASDLVPKSWRLFRQRPGYDAECIASGVVAYDIAADGTVAYSNGNAIFMRDPKGGTERIHVERMIEQVNVLP